MLVTLLIVVFWPGVLGLRLVKLDVPGAVMRGDPIWLNCSFDLESDELYSVKWYKNNVEFYRYLPSDRPPSQKYDQIGVYLDLGKSHEGHLYLYRSDLHTEGTYRCEVSAEAPSFQTIREQNDIRIYVIPKEGPILKGLRPHYGIGDEVNVSCSSPPSKPPAVLTWFINDRMAPPQFVLNYAHKYHNTQLKSTSIGLKYVATKSQYPNGLMKLKCVANYTTISSITSDEYYATNSTKPLGPHLALSSLSGSPVIGGARRRYELGDSVFVNCTAPKTLGHTQLKWFINYKDANPEDVSPHKELISSDGRRIDLVALNFVVQSHHFQNGVMRLKCSAVLEETISRMKEEIVGGSQPSSGYRVSELTGDNDGINIAPSQWIVVPLLAFLQLEFMGV